MAELTTGVLLDDRYELIERRASGATAVVWAADDAFLHRRVAIKLLHPHIAEDGELLARFINEARTAATVSHPSLVAVYDSIVELPGIVMEWVDGADLRQRLDEGPLPAADIARIGAEIADGLAELHRHGLIHRDVKPANILLAADGRAKLTDFGIATANAGDRTATGIVLGTPKYLAPEQVRGQTLDPRTDLFALSAVLYEAASGAAPWIRDGDLPTAIARLDDDPVDLRTSAPLLPANLSAAIMRGLSRAPDARWPNAADYAAALRRTSRLRPPPAPPRTSSLTVASTSAAPATDSPIRRRRRVWPRLLGLALMAAIGLLGTTLVAGTLDNPAPVASPLAGQTIPLVSSVAFDPEGTGTPGEHNDQAALAIDGDRTTSWPTEQYEARDLGTKSGVGLVISLDRVRQFSRVHIETDGAQNWGVEIRASDASSVGNADSIGDYGPPIAAESGLPAAATIDVNATADTLVVWITDLGDGDTPLRLNVAEITVQ